MSAAKNMNVYLNNHYEGMSPEKLIHMLFKAAIKHLEQAKQGIIEKDIKKRGEHLSKAIAIISELNTSLDPEMKDESTQFLRGLYSSILAELPKVSLTNEVKPIDLTLSYIKKLNEIWETTVLNQAAPVAKKPPAPKARPYPPTGYGAPGGTSLPKSIFA